MVLEDGVDLKKAGTDVQVVFEPVVLELDEVAVGKRTVGLQFRRQFV